MNELDWFTYKKMEPKENKDTPTTTNKIGNCARTIQIWLLNRRRSVRSFMRLVLLLAT